MWSRLAWILPVLVLAGSAAQQPLAAQAWQCTAPLRLSRPTLELPPPGAIRRVPVAGFTLALSWSPEFCKGRELDPAKQLQCAGKIGDFGFVLHGLWPAAKGPDNPMWCRTSGLISRQLMSDNICMTPDVQLLQHQWAKHGSCMARRPETYFGAAKLMFEAIDFPDMAALSRKPLTAADLAEKFETYNEGLPASAVRVQLNERGWLQEVRICLGKRFLPQACPRFAEGAPAKAQVKIWRGR